MKGLYLVMAAAAFVCGCASAQAPKVDICAIQTAPKDAYPVYVEGGGAFFRYPNDIPYNYTGCQVMWIVVEGKEARTVLHFSDGTPDLLESYEGSQLLSSCRLNNKEANKESAECFGVDSEVKILQKAKSFKSPIPPDQDPCQHENGHAQISQADQAALPTLMAEAQKGDADAQTNLGRRYEDGEGVAQDYSQAMLWYRKAADQGNAAAQSKVGFFYAGGKGVAQDASQAVRWYRRAADQGYAKAGYDLGTCYRDGFGVPKDYSQAAQWYRKAAEQGYVNAQMQLGILYTSGQGVPLSNVAAAALFSVSTGRGIASDSTWPKLTQQEVESARTLRDKMSKPGNLLKALDEYLAAHPSGGQ